MRSTARTCLRTSSANHEKNGKWRTLPILAGPIHAGYDLKREGEKYVMTRLNFPEPPVNLEDWLECNPLVRKRRFRLE